MIRRPPISKRTYTLFPSPTLFRSVRRSGVVGVAKADNRIKERARVARAILAAELKAAVQADLETGQRLERDAHADNAGVVRSEEHTSELQSLMRTSYAVFCLKKQKII